MTPPKQVTIGGHRIAVIVDDSIGEFGNFSQDSMEIRIRTMPAKQTRETLRHEMVHAALAIGGQSYSDKYCEESIVRCLDYLFWPAWEKIDT